LHLPIGEIGSASRVTGIFTGAALAQVAVTLSLVAVERRPARQFGRNGTGDLAQQRMFESAAVSQRADR
jgi:hypothetical protein